MAGLVIWGLWRSRAKRSGVEAKAAEASQSGREPMRRCAECGVHLPDSLALPGRGGHFCSSDHRQRFEARHPE